MEPEQRRDGLRALVHTSELHLWPAVMSCQHAIEWFNVKYDTQLGKELDNAVSHMNSAITSLRVAMSELKDGN